MKIGSFEDLYANDESKSENGVPMEIGINAKDEPIVFIVAEMGNSKNEKVARRYEKALESSRRDKKKRRMIWSKILSESILLDWKGVLDADGNPVPPTTENKIAALQKYDKLFGDVMEFSQNADNFRPDGELTPAEESEKNLPTGSPGTPVTAAS